MHRFVETFLLIGLSGAVAEGAPVDYVKEVKPVLAEHCYRCHGASQQKSGLRLDTAAFALKGGENGMGYRPGKSAESLLVQAVKGTHDDISRMPYKKPPLAVAQIETIARWIDEGAKAPADEAPESNKHWAFVAPVRGPLPEVKQTDWPRNAIDRFILARLEQETIKPSPEADRITLIRRVSLDLTGLPQRPPRWTPLWTTRDLTLMRAWLIACSPLRITANGGGGTGSTWRVTQTRMVTALTRRATFGNTAIGSLTP
jgi:mono/diheme cytochrome c family protein